jgi:AcrR family transcriptional regulator
MGFGKEKIAASITEKTKKLLFAKHPTSITMDMIAKETGITPVTLYKYCESKNNLINTTYRAIVTDINNLVDIRFPGNLKNRMKLMIIFNNLAEYFYSNRVYPTWLVEDPHPLPVNLKKMRSIISNLFRHEYSCSENTSHQITNRFLAMLQAELLYHRSIDKPLPENIVEDIFNLPIA